MSKYEETLVGNIIQEKIPIEWMRYNMYLSTNIYKNIPMLVFRTQKSCPNSLVEELKKSVDNFKGKLKWRVFKNPLTRKGDYILSISNLEDLYTQCYLEQIQYNQIDFWGAESYKKLCEDAILDIPMLAKHIEETC